MPVSCHFRDCKALLVTSLTHVRSAVARSGPLPLHRVLPLLETVLYVACLRSKVCGGGCRALCWQVAEYRWSTVGDLRLSPASQSSEGSLSAVVLNLKSRPILPFLPRLRSARHIFLCSRRRCRPSADMICGHPPSYTSWFIKRYHFILDYNFRVSWWILTLLVPIEIGVNALQFTFLVVLKRLMTS